MTDTAFAILVIVGFNIISYIAITFQLIAIENKIEKLEAISRKISKEEE